MGCGVWPEGKSFACILGLRWLSNTGCTCTDKRVCVGGGEETKDTGAVVLAKRKGGKEGAQQFNNQLLSNVFCPLASSPRVLPLPLLGALAH